MTRSRESRGLAGKTARPTASTAMAIFLKRAAPSFGGALGGSHRRRLHRTLRWYKTTPDEPCVMLHPLNRPGSKEEIDQVIADAQEMAAPGSIPIVPLNLSDGPIRLDGFVEKRVIGRVVGVYQAEDLVLGHAS